MRRTGRPIRRLRLNSKTCAAAIASLGEAAFDHPTLPGWTRRNLVAHLAANGEAIGRLLRWARTGEPTPMYASTEQRGADIAAGARLSGTALRIWFEHSADELAAAFAAMSPESWRAQVVTAQGRTVPASETVWMRSREVLIHAVDLNAGTTFTDLPVAFLAALRDEVLLRRAGEGVADLRGSLADVAAYLTGRRTTGVTMADGSPAPALGPWI